MLRLAQQMRAESEYERAIEYAQKILASDPANKHVYQHLIFSYVALGNGTATLKRDKESRRALGTELAVEPSRETGALYEWILHEPAEHTTHA